MEHARQNEPKKKKEKRKYPPNLYKRGEAWYVSFYYRGLRYTENLGPVSTTAAKEILHKRKVAAAEGKLDLAQRVQDLTFEAAVEKYLQYYKANRRPKSYERHSFSSEHLKKAFGGRRLSMISAFLIEKYKRDRKEAEAAEATINRELSMLKNLFNKCMGWGFAKKNPVCEVKFYREDNARTRYLSEEEVQALMGACDSDLTLVVQMAMQTGLRTSELKSVKWSNIDLVNRSVTVESAYAKNGETRTIPLNALLTQVLTALRIKMKPAVDDPVLTRDGKAWVSWRTAFENAVERAGIRDFRFHDLRHCFGSYLAMADVNEKARMELMGHKDPKMTLRYTHLSVDYKRQAVEKLAARLDSSKDLQTASAGTEVTTKVTTAATASAHRSLQVVNS